MTCEFKRTDILQIYSPNKCNIYRLQGHVTYDKFKETWIAVSKEFGCEERVKTVFEVFASLSGKDDTTVIGKEDLEALMDFLAGVGELIL